MQAKNFLLVQIQTSYLSKLENKLEGIPVAVSTVSTKQQLKIALSK